MIGGGGSFFQRLHSSQAPGLFVKASLLGDRRSVLFLCFLVDGECPNYSIEIFQVLALHKG